MIDYGMIALHDFITKNYKLPLTTTENKYKVQVEGIESRYVDGLVFGDLQYLASEVHAKVIDKFADKIADDVVDKILSQIAENKKEKE